MNKYDPKSFEEKWKKVWKETEIYKRKPIKEGQDKYYSLYSFPYPSGEGLHVGHVEGMVANDVPARYQRMKGKNVVLPMGWDSFGLPAENYAIKTGVPPAETTAKSIENFKTQIDLLGISVDWDTEVGAHWPEYYKWTQWIFLQMFKKGIAYKKSAPVNWCPKDQTVLANEQVINGKCERCDTEVVQKEMSQWFFKITDYAERLNNDLSKIDWPESTKQQQINWIGKSEGAEIIWKVKNPESAVNFEMHTFTTRFDTIPGPTFVVVAPEYKDLDKLVTSEHKSEVEKYIEATKGKSELERQTNKEKTGVFTGSYTINPYNGEEVPVYVADYVLNNYGTGAVMGMPGHDKRDWDFAKKFNLPVKYTLKPKDEEIEEGGYYEGEGYEVNSGEFDGLFWTEARDKIIEKLVNEGKAIKRVNFRLRDWLVSRQRYWGCPIPILYKDRVVADKTILINGFGATKDSYWYKNITTISNNFEVSEINYESLDVEDVVEKLKSRLTEKSSLIGHSLGINIVLKYAENSKVNQLILVAPKESQEIEVNYSKVLENAEEIVILYSNDDQYVNNESYKAFRAKLGSNIKVIEKIYSDKGHFQSNSIEEFKEFFTDKIIAAVPEKDLPLLLPTDVDFRPTGESPIARSESFKKQAEEQYGKGWHYEVDTMDTFVDSSWYFFRQIDPHNTEIFASKENADYWLPTDLYMIGAEHTVLHLLYSRFFTKFLCDEGYISFDEPFYYMRHMGLIQGPDGRKMSKRWGNVINPTDEVNKYGADTVRMYEMFMGPLEDAKPWNDRAESGVFRFLVKVWDLQNKVKQESGSKNQELIVNKLIKKVGDDIESLSFNTSVAKFMETVNFFQKEETISKNVWETFLKVLAPFAPYITEELWSVLGYEDSIHNQIWPEVNESLLIEEQSKIAIQVNGKVRAVIEMPTDSEEIEVLAKAMEQESVKKFVTSDPKKVVYVKNKILSIIV